MIVAGVDPGAHGSIAIINDKLEVLLLVDMPKEDRTFVDVIKSHQYIVDETYIEDVHALPKQSTVSSFTFGKNVGKAELIAEALGNPKKVTPQVWKAYFSLKRNKEESKIEYKHRSITKAKELFPEVADRLTASKDGRAEALLIALYGLKHQISCCS